MVIYLPCCYGEYDPLCGVAGDVPPGDIDGFPCNHRAACMEETFNYQIRYDFPNGDIFRGF
jgi:hypothetical protein